MAKVTKVIQLEASAPEDIGDLFIGDQTGVLYIRIDKGFVALETRGGIVAGTVQHAHQGTFTPVQSNMRYILSQR